MLTKIKGVLMSPAPAEGESGGTSTGSESNSSAAESTNASEAESGSGGEGDGNSEGVTSDASHEDDQSNFADGFDFDQMLAYDPFKQPAETQSESQSADPAKQQGQETADGERQTGQGQQAPAETTEKTKGQEAKESPELKLLREQNQQLIQALNNMQQNAEQTAATKTAEQAQKGQQTEEQVRAQRHETIAKSLPGYQFNIPDTVMQKMGSDDPAQIRAGLGEFAQGVAQVTHYNMAMQMEERFEKLRQELLQESVQNFRQTTQQEEAVKKQQSEVFNDFYGKFPELNKPELQEFVKMQAKLLAQRYGVPRWNESFRDTLGEHVKTLLGLGQQGPQPDADKGQGGQPTVPGKRFSAGSNSGRQNSGAPSLPDDIADTLLG